MQVAPPGGQFFQFMQVVAKIITTNTSVATWWPNFQLMKLELTFCIAAISLGFRVSQICQDV